MKENSEINLDKTKAVTPTEQLLEIIEVTSKAVEKGITNKDWEFVNIINNIRKEIAPLVRKALEENSPWELSQEVIEPLNKHLLEIMYETKTLVIKKINNKEWKIVGELNEWLKKDFAPLLRNKIKEENVSYPDRK